MKVSTKTALMLAALSAGLIGNSPVSLAQEASFEEVVVTAQKREQSLQEVGISIAAFSSSDLESNRILDVTGVTEFVPNVELALSPDNDIPIFVVRGVGLQDYNANNTPTTALVVDDVYQPYGVYGMFALFDAARVEILKGPQGGLYGRNSTGGAVNIVTRKPSFEAVEANVAADAGNYGMANVRAGISVPLTDTFAARLAAQYDTSDGYYYNTYLNRDQGGKDKLQSRLTLSFAPSDSFSADLRVTVGRNRSEVGIPELEGILDPDPAVWNPGPLVGLGSPDMNVPFEFDAEGNTIPFLCPAVINTGIPDATCINANGFAPDGDPYAGDDAIVRKNDDDFTAATLNLEFDLGPVSLLSITSVASMDFSHSNGIGSVGIADYQNPAEWADFGALVGRAHRGATDPNYVTRYNSDISSWSQEFRVLSSGDGMVSWMAGAVYAEDELNEDRDCEFPANLWYDYLAFPGCGRMIYDQNTDAWSIYGQVGFDLSDTFRLTIDGRYTGEKKDYTGGVWINDGAWTCLLTGNALDETCAPFGDPYDPATNLLPLAIGATANYDKKEPSYKVNLDWSPTGDLLVYLSAGQTFKSGGFFGGFFFDPAAVVAYNPEKNFAIELGAKSTFADGRARLNAAVFKYDYTDFQGNLQATGPGAEGGVFSGLANLGDVDVLGFEADLQWLPTDGLTLGLGIGLLDSEVKKVADLGFTDPNTIVGVTDITQQVVPIVGNELNKAPKFSGNVLARYEFNFGSRLSARLQADASWTDDYYLSVANDPYSREQGVTLVNAHAAILGGSGAAWTVTLWGRNLTDEAHRTSTNFDGIWDNYSNWSEPRTYGVTITYRYQ